METTWACGKCGKIYTFNEHRTLKSEWKDPLRTEYGKVSICNNCGNKFSVFMWNIKTFYRFFPNILTCWLYPTLEVSTIHLEVSRDGMFYETMIFARPKITSMISYEVYECYRWITKEEAEKGHKMICKKIKNKDYTFRENNKGYLELKLKWE